MFVSTDGIDFQLIVRQKLAGVLPFYRNMDVSSGEPRLELTSRDLITLQYCVYAVLTGDSLKIIGGMRARSKAAACPLRCQCVSESAKTPVDIVSNFHRGRSQKNAGES